MAAGEVALSIEGSTDMRLYADTGQAGCEVTETDPGYSYNPLQAMRLLFGPLSPSAVTPLASGAGNLDAWCPLPLSWRMQDGV